MVPAGVGAVQDQPAKQLAVVGPQGRAHVLDDLEGFGIASGSVLPWKSPQGNRSGRGSRLKAPALLVGCDLVLVLQGQGDIVQAIAQAVAAKVVGGRVVVHHEGYA